MRRLGVAVPPVPEGPRVARRRRGAAADVRPGGGRASELFVTSALSDTRLGLPDDLVAEVGKFVSDCPGLEEVQGLLVAGVVEESHAAPEHDRVDHQP